MSLDDAGEHMSSRRSGSALARITFCFAWLFGLEPFLTASAESEPRSKRLDRH
jgi:preprotein translocase subunit SecG